MARSNKLNRTNRTSSASDSTSGSGPNRGGTLTCPEPNCNRVFSGKRARQALAMHRLKAHGVPTVQPRIEKDPSISVLENTIRLLKLKVTEADLEKRLPQPEPQKSSVPSMQEATYSTWLSAQADLLEAKAQALKNPPAASAGDSGELSELRAELRVVKEKLDAKRDDEISALRDELREVRKERAHPASSSSEKVELSRLVADTVDRVGDRISAKLDPVVGWIFQGNPGEKKFAPGARDNSEILKKIRPEYVVEE